MGTLTVIRKQENPDGIEGHEERQAMKAEYKNELPKRKYTVGRSEHRYTKLKLPIIEKRGYDPEKLLAAREFCKLQCTNGLCALKGW